jgi:hypothetical protein
MLQAVQDLTGWPDADLARIINKSRATVQCYRSGALHEYLDGRQCQNLRAAVRLWRDQIIAGVDELELLL